MSMVAGAFSEVEEASMLVFSSLEVTSTFGAPPSEGTEPFSVSWATGSASSFFSKITV